MNNEYREAGSGTEMQIDYLKKRPLQDVVKAVKMTTL